MADSRARTKDKAETQWCAALGRWFGDCTTEALGDWLGLSAAEVEALHKDGVV